MKMRKMFASSVCAMVLTGSVVAQQPPSASPASATQGKNANASRSMQETIATCLALDNEEEVILAKFAIEKSQDKNVAAFAKALVESHGKCLKDLTKLEPNLANRKMLMDQSSPTGERSTSNANAPTSQTNSQTNSQTSSQVNSQASSQQNMDGMPDLLQLQTEMAQQCLADSKVMLNKDGGKHFDECFVGMQIAKHASMQSKLTVLERHTTGELKDLVTKGLAMTKDHMAKAETLMKSLADNDDDAKPTK
jgi:predicted outer membrane protein